MGTLHRLYRRLQDHEGLPEVQEFKEVVILPASRGTGDSDA
jgi:hypothetical protein